MGMAKQIERRILRNSPRQVYYPGSGIRGHLAERFRNMPAKSKKQQMAAGAALAAKRGERKKSSLKGASRQMANSMSKKQHEEFASTKRKTLPAKKRK